jgi:hypothetical protein
VAPLEMNAGTCWGKNTIDPGGRSVEKAPGSDFNFSTNTQKQNTKQKKNNRVGKSNIKVLEQKP